MASRKSSGRGVPRDARGPKAYLTPVTKIARRVHGRVREEGAAFPEWQGFSPRNVWQMRASFVAWSGARKELTQPVSETGVVPANPGLTPRLPAVLEGSLPAVEEIEAALSSVRGKR